MHNTTSFGQATTIDVVVQEYPLEAPTTRFCVINFNDEGSSQTIHPPKMGAEQARVLRKLAMNLLRAADELEAPMPAPAPAVCVNCQGTGWFGPANSPLRCAVCDSDGADAPPPAPAADPQALSRIDVDIPF